MVHGDVRRSVLRVRQARGCSTAACLCPPTLRLPLGVANNIAVNFPAVVVQVIRRQAICDEGRPEDRSEYPTNVPAEGQAEGTGTRERDPVTLSCKSTASDAVHELVQARVGFDGFRWSDLGKR